MITIEPIKCGDEYYVHLSMDGQPLSPHGPVSSADEAEALATRLAGFCAVMDRVVVGRPQMGRKR